MIRGFYLCGDDRMYNDLDFDVGTSVSPEWFVNKFPVWPPPPPQRLIVPTLNKSYIKVEQ